MTMVGRPHMHSTPSTGWVGRAGAGQAIRAHRDRIAPCTSWKKQRLKGRGPPRKQAALAVAYPKPPCKPSHCVGDRTAALQTELLADMYISTSSLKACGKCPPHTFMRSTGMYTVPHKTSTDHLDPHHQAASRSSSDHSAAGRRFIRVMVLLPLCPLRVLQIRRWSLVLSVPPQKAPRNARCCAEGSDECSWELQRRAVLLAWSCAITGAVQPHVHAQESRRYAGKPTPHAPHCVREYNTCILRWQLGHDGQVEFTS